MRRSLAYFLCVSPLLAQSGRPEPQQAPIDALIQGYQSAYSNGRFGEAAAKRDQARALLSQTPANDPQFANWAQRVSGIYENGGFAAQARGVLEQALARVTALGDQSPARVALLIDVANSWQQDRNLLTALSYTEQAATAAETEAPRTAQAPAAVSPWFSASTGGASVMIGAFRGGPGADNGEIYRRLLTLYKELGRPQDAAAVLTRIAAHVKNGESLLASLYQQQGQTDEAAAIYKREAAQAADPQQAALALEQLASLYQSTQRYSDAASAWQEAIGKIEASGDPAAIQSSVWVRQSLANMLQQAGQIQAADKVYQQLMTGNANQQVGIVTTYANFLAATNRSDQAETLLKDYQASHASSEPWEQNSLLMTLANVEARSGNPKAAEEYRRQASASQPQPAQPAEQNRIADTLQRAQQAANAGKLDEAFNLTVSAIESAPVAPNREMAPWSALQIAGTLAPKAPAQANEIYRRTFALVESWAPDTVAPLSNSLQRYAGLLLTQQRWAEFEQTLERYRATVTAARGSGTGWLEDVLRLRTGVISPPEELPGALAASQELAKLEESLSGATSEPYLRAIETLAFAMEASGDRAGTLPLRRKTVTIADLVYPANDARRAMIRMSAAMAYANERQFDEAETLAKEAVSIGQHLQPAQPDSFTNQLKQILQMKKAAQSASPPKQ
jgi:tetratricopeptide (TPR) repeat protein